MRISVIIPVYKPTKKFYKLITSLGKQSMRPDKVVLMFTEDENNKTEDFVLDVKKHFEQTPIEAEYGEDISVPFSIICKKVLKSEFDHGKTRHLGALAAASDIMIFMTDDAVPQDEWVIEKLVKAFEDPNVAVAYARQLPRRGEEISESYTRLYNYPSKSHVYSKNDVSRIGVKAYFCSDVCAAYNRNTYFELGGFDERTLFGEDTLFAAKAINAGYSVAYVASAKVIHSHALTLSKLFKRNFDIGATHAMHPKTFKKGTAQKEGMKYVKSTCDFLLGQRRMDALIYFLIGCCAKYAGYITGTYYKFIPEILIERFSDNKNFWRKR